MKTNYTNGTVSFGHVGKGKWQFSHVTADGYTFDYTNNIAGGKVTASKVANVVGGAMKRTSGRGLDNLARANIIKIVGSV